MKKSVAFTTPIFMKPTIAPRNCVQVSSIEICPRQELWRVLIEIHLRPWVNRGIRWADFHETHATRRHFNINSIQIFIKPRQTVFTFQGRSWTIVWRLHIRLSAFLVCKELLVIKCVQWCYVICQCGRSRLEWYFSSSLPFTYNWKLLLPFSWFFIKLWFYPHYYVDRNFRPLDWSISVCN